MFQALMESTLVAGFWSAVRSVRHWIKKLSLNTQLDDWDLSKTCDLTANLSNKDGQLWDYANESISTANFFCSMHKGRINYVKAQIT